MAAVWGLPEGFSFRLEGFGGCLQVVPEGFRLCLKAFLRRRQSELSRRPLTITNDYRGASFRPFLRLRPQSLTVTATITDGYSHNH